MRACLKKNLVNIKSRKKLMQTRFHHLQLYFNEAGGQLGAAGIPEPSERHNPDVHLTSCLPLSKVLLGLKYTHINYLSLDVEGLEYNILEAFPYDSIQVDYISVEYLHVRQGQEAIIQLMTTHGYTFLDKLYSIDECRETFVHDFLFVKKNLG